MRNILKNCLLLLSILIYSCEEKDLKPSKSDESKQVPTNHEPNLANARSSPGITVFKDCMDNDNLNDYLIEAAIAFNYVDWYLINPWGVQVEHVFVSSPGKLNQHTFAPVYDQNAISGTWTVEARGYNWAGEPGYTQTYPFTIPLQGIFLSSGTSGVLDAYTSPHEYNLPLGYTVNDILDMAIDYENNYVFTWFKDGKRCSGTTSNLAAHSGPVPFTLPPGYTVDQIVAIDIDGDVERAYTWYSNGKRSIGSSTDLDKYGSPVNYKLPTGYTPNMIIDIAIDGNVNWSWVYFTNGKKCAGSTTNLSSFSGLSNYTVACNYTLSDIVGIACDGDINTIYAWYKK